MTDGTSQGPTTPDPNAPGSSFRVPVLSAVAIGKDYETPRGSLQILDECSLELHPGDTVAIMGPSGSGKSTLLAILGTLEPPSRGRLLLTGEDPFEFPEAQLAAFRNRQIGFVFQDHLLLPYCTALENVVVPALAGPDRDAAERDPAQTSALTRAEQLLSRVGLADRMDHRPAELSGGERQRTAIARALINQPRLLLADEPTGNLDRASADGVARLLLDVAAEQRAALVAVTHSRALADQFKRRYELVGGRLTPLS
ncbi:MAG: ABC transporter ATP-binding protein [Planctomycetia bacterium]|nr:MAG: ABC transporter ATP-binding protein [Planctomycetia bacterium]RIK66493.1 MAG: ATP-binding protein [Planctomycetota bacterium]